MTDEDGEQDALERDLTKYFQTPDGWNRFREAVRLNFESYLLNSHAFEDHVKALAANVVDERSKASKNAFWTRDLWKYVTTVIVALSVLTGVELTLNNIVSRAVVKALGLEKIAAQVQVATFVEKVAIGNSISFVPDSTLNTGCATIITAYSAAAAPLSESDGSFFFNRCFGQGQVDSSLGDSVSILVPAKEGDVLHTFFWLYGYAAEEEFESRKRYLFSELLNAKNRTVLLDTKAMIEAVKDLALSVDGEKVQFKLGNKKGVPFGGKILDVSFLKVTTSR
jgi:hypothetical protein